MCPLIGRNNQTFNIYPKSVRDCLGVNDSKTLQPPVPTKTMPEAKKESEISCLPSAAEVKEVVEKSPVNPAKSIKMGPYFRGGAGGTIPIKSQDDPE